MSQPQNDKVSCVWESVNNQWASETWDGKVAHIVEWSETEDQAVTFLRENYSEYTLLPWQEFQTRWRNDIGNPKAKLFGDGKFKPLPKRTATSTSTTMLTPHSSKLELLEGETAETLVAPVAMAKRLGLPPQYVYQAISKGRIKTVGERPKKATVAEYARAYRKEVIPYGTVPPTGVAGETGRSDTPTA